jgi:hypothetical protein
MGRKLQHWRIHLEEQCSIWRSQFCSLLNESFYWKMRWGQFVQRFV